MEIDTLTRLIITVSVFSCFASLELLYPNRTAHTEKPKRWFANLGIFFVTLLVVGIPIGVFSLGLLAYSESRGWGLMNVLDLPNWVEVIIGFLLLDALLYFQHRLSHSLPILWRLHRVHHADTEMDVTTANRIHPLETCWLIFLRTIFCILLGIPLLALELYLIALSVVSIFNHTNVRLPIQAEKWISKLLVTPLMHETHHSAEVEDFDTNFSFLFSFWDRCFGTYREQPVAKASQITFGINQFREKNEISVGKLLTQPFR